MAVVYPGSTKDVQAVVNLARREKIALYAVGGGTVLLIGSIPGKNNFGITFDFHRMQKITVDKERMVVRAQPGATGLQVSQVVREMDFGYRPYFGGSPGNLTVCSLPGVYRPEQDGGLPGRHGHQLRCRLWKWCWQAVR